MRCDVDNLGARSGRIAWQHVIVAVLLISTVACTTTHIGASSPYCGESFCVASADFLFREKKDDLEDYVVHYFDVRGARVSIYEGNAPQGITPEGSATIDGLDWLYGREGAGMLAVAERGMKWPSRLSVYVDDPNKEALFQVLRELEIRRDG